LNPAIYSIGSTDIRLNDARQRDGSVPELGPPRCFQCFRPQAQCYCDLIPRIQNETEIVLVQHVSERDHPFNTARMVRASLDRTKLVCGNSERLVNLDLGLVGSAGLLYPSKTAKTLANVPKNERPTQLVVIDGTWPQAKALVRDLPQLRDLPHYQLLPTEPGNYRIRLEPNEVSLSTLEAVVEALRELEPELTDLEKLVKAFETMVQRQLDHPKVFPSHYSGGKKSGRNLNIPASLITPDNSIVVAYGEMDCLVETETVEKSKVQRGPLVWSAHRLGGSFDSDLENFESFLQPRLQLKDTFLTHLGLSHQHFANGESLSEFRDRWGEFLQDGDTLVVYHPNGIRMLKHVNAKLAKWITLKSINFNGQVKRRTFGEFVKDECTNFDVKLPHSGRAGRRLAKAVSMVNYLRDVGLKNSEAESS